MIKTTVYLPVELKRELERVAAQSGRSEAEIIRDGIRLALVKTPPPAPTLSVFDARDPEFLDDLDALMDGFGER